MAEGITLKRIIDMDEAAELTSSDYALVDSSTGGPKKFAIGEALGEIKDGLTDVKEDSKYDLKYVVGKENYLHGIKWNAGAYISATGVISPYATAKYTDLIPVEADTLKYYYRASTSSSTTRVHGYDTNGDWVAQITTAITGSTVEDKYISINAKGYSYIRISESTTISPIAIINPPDLRSELLDVINSDVKNLEKDIANGYWRYTTWKNRGWARNNPNQPSYQTMTTRVGFEQLLFCRKGTKLFVNCGNDREFFVCQFVDTDGYWTTPNWGQWETESRTVTIDRDSYIAVVVAKSGRADDISVDEIGVTVDVTYPFYVDYAKIKEAESVVGLNESKREMVYAACRYGIDNRDTVKDLCLTVFADIHGSEVQCNNIITFSNAYKNVLDGVVCLGDVRAVKWTDPIKFYTDAITKSELPVYTVVGSHDKGDNVTAMGSREELYSDFFVPTNAKSDVPADGKCYFYKDYTDKKIRMIALNQYDQPSTKDDNDVFVYNNNPYYSQEQITWFLDTLATTPSDYSVLLIYNNAIEWTYDTSEWTDARHRGKTAYEPSYFSKDIIPDIVDAFIRKEQISKTYSASGVSDTIVANKDFSSRTDSKFIAHFVGHNHCDGISHLHENQLLIVFNTSSGSANVYRGQDTIRNQTEVSTDCFTVVGIDTQNKVIRLARIGATHTIDMSERIGVTIPYTT